jgi:hypothetical protein
MATLLTGRFSRFDHLKVSVTLKPTVLDLPTIAGVAQVGQVLTARPGRYRGVPAPTLNYQWFAAGYAIPGATGSTFTVQAAQAQKLVSVSITATNAVGSITNSAPGVTIAAIIKNYPSTTYPASSVSGVNVDRASALSKDGRYFGIVGRIYTVGDTGALTLLQSVSASATNFGENVAFSRDGTYYAVASSHSVYIYKLTNGTWIAFGQITTGPNTYPGIRSLSLSEDGQRVAFCSQTTSQMVGSIYRQNGAGGWVSETAFTSSQYGNSLGCDLAMNGNADRVIVGGYSYFQIYDRSGTSWTKVYDTIAVQGQYSNLGTGVAINRAGTRVAAVASGTTNYVFAYQMGATSNQWTAGRIVGSYSGGNSGNDGYCSFSDDGTLIGYGIPYFKIGVTKINGSNLASATLTESQLVKENGDRPGSRYVTISGDGYTMVSHSYLWKAR